MVLGTHSSLTRLVLTLVVLNAAVSACVQATVIKQAAQKTESAGGGNFRDPTAGTPTVPPADPTNFSAVSVESFVIELSWTDNSINEAGFSIERQTAAGTDSFVQIAQVPADSTHYRDATATAGVKYNYRLRARNGFADSEYTDTITVQAKNQIVGFIGDSITAGVGCNTTNCPNGVISAGAALQAAGRTVTVINRGVSGSTTHDWLPTGTLLNNAIAAFTAAKVETVSIMLGANDCKFARSTAPSDYRNNLQTTIGKLLDPATGIKHVIMQEPLYVVPGALGIWDATALPLLIQYAVELDALSNVTKGDRTAYEFFKANPALLADGVHPSPAGHLAMGKIWAAAIIAAGL